MNRDRDRDPDRGVAVEDILSQLSKDETLLREVRKLAFKGLKATGSSGDNQLLRAASQEVEHNRNGPSNSGDTSASEAEIRNPQKMGTTGARASGAEDVGEELAFTLNKDSDTYRNIYSTVQWYRDSFLIGSSFADQRSVERKSEGMQANKQNAKQCSIPKPDPKTAMGHPLLLSSAVNYIRSVAAIDLLKPYATWVASKGGPMFPTASQSLAQSIPLAQSSCDWAMRENLLWVLKDEEWREFAKNITTSYVDRSYKEG
ncbi:hypothetical protein ACHAWF_007001 [Thalassiosira exigua]